jgi:hypothetical protein
MIPREVIGHHLKIYPDARPVQQKPQKHSVERQNFIREEIKKLLNYTRQTESFGCASTTQVSTRHVPKTLFSFHE